MSYFSQQLITKANGKEPKTGNEREMKAPKEHIVQGRDITKEDQSQRSRFFFWKI